MKLSASYTCEACGNNYVDDDVEQAVGEATAVFRPDELVDVARVCDDCWRRMRDAMPDLDARYREQGR
jgi:hypothetical protein